MPTTDPITTDRLAACVRDGVTAQSALTAAAQPVADRLAILIHRRLPDTAPADSGAVMLHIAAFYADVMTVLTEQGHPVADAVQIATSAIAMAGTELYDSQDTQAATDRVTLDAAGRIRAWRQQLDADTRAALARGSRPIPEPLYPADEEVSCRYGCGTDLRADDGTELPLLLADIDTVLAALQPPAPTAQPEVPDAAG